MISNISFPTSSMFETSLCKNVCLAIDPEVCSLETKGKYSEIYACMSVSIVSVCVVSCPPR
jgi:hypothetical protein